MGRNTCVVFRSSGPVQFFQRSTLPSKDFDDGSRSFCKKCILLRPNICSICHIFFREQSRICLKSPWPPKFSLLRRSPSSLFSGGHGHGKQLNKHITVGTAAILDPQGRWERDGKGRGRCAGGLLLSWPDARRRFEPPPAAKNYKKDSKS